MAQYKKPPAISQSFKRIMIERIIEFLEYLANRWKNRESLKLGGAKRSSQWPKVRAEFLKKNPGCAICGLTDKKYIQVHHRLPFSQDPSLELKEENLIVLCDAPGREHHLNFGHLGSFRSWNSEIEIDSKIWRTKIANRP